MTVTITRNKGTRMQDADVAGWCWRICAQETWDKSLKPSSFCHRKPYVQTGYWHQNDNDNDNDHGNDHQIDDDNDNANVDNNEGVDHHGNGGDGSDNGGWWWWWLRRWCQWRKHDVDCRWWCLYDDDHGDMMMMMMVMMVSEGSLEVKLPTIWTVEKQRWKESEEKRSEERRCRCAKR